ncbi:ATP-binding protein [Sorangium sp. So ce381]|uniref:ATP-binding protein n=1 Tax=Sorangium sp. So ce381 TaxID=3133307 RepID=UPI003F5B22CF
MRGVSGTHAARASAERAGRTYAASSAKGLGLGLFIVQSIVDAHGGSIQVTSTLEEGTTFRVKLPRSS